jgi:tetratricopeptide (TPR) repeat protein
MECADSAERFGDFATALEYREKLLVYDPEDLESQLALLRLYWEVGNSEEVARSLRRSGELADQSNNTAVLDMLASAGYLPSGGPTRPGRLEEAIRSHRAILAAEKPDPSSKEYARIQFVLGGLYKYKAQSQTGAERVESLRDAAKAYQAALGGYSAETFPVENRILRLRLLDAERLLSEAIEES